LTVFGGSLGRADRVALPAFPECQTRPRRTPAASESDALENQALDVTRVRALRLADRLKTL